MGLVHLRRTDPRRTDALDEVLEAEQASGKELDAERAKAAAWLDAERKTIEERAESELAAIDAAAVEQTAAAKRAAVANAEAIVRDADAFASRLAGFDQERLARIVRERIGSIVPGGRP